MMNIRIRNDVLKQRIDYIKNNKNEITDKIHTIIKDQFEEKTIDQTELIPEQKIFLSKSLKRRKH